MHVKKITVGNNILHKQFFPKCENKMLVCIYDFWGQFLVSYLHHNQIKQLLQICLKV